MRILYGMKKQIKLKSAAFCSAALLSPFLANVSSLGGIRDVARPYLGVYECEELYFGEENKKDRFDYVRIELLPEGEMKLFYKEKEGRKRTLEARYSYDTKTDTLTVYADVAGEEKKKQFSVEKGKIDVSVRYGGKMLMMKFVRK